MARIKICGLRRRADIDFVNALKPDYIGFILTPGFRRSIDFKTAEYLKKALHEDIKAVGVFVDDDAEYINSFIDSGIIDAVQLHGSESPEVCCKIHAPVIKVLQPCDFDKTKEYEAVCDFFLFDSGTGTGKTFEWGRIPKTEKPFFLAGGLDAQNVKTAIETVKPYAVDVSSAVEANGIKDFDKIKKFMENAKNE